MFSLIETNMDHLVDTFKSVSEEKKRKKGKKTIVQKFAEFLLEQDDGKSLMEKVTTLYIKALIPPEILPWLRNEAAGKNPYSRKITEALQSKKEFREDASVSARIVFKVKSFSFLMLNAGHSETAFGTAIFENDLKMTKEEEKGATKIFVSTLVAGVQQKAAKKWDDEVIERCAQRVARSVGFQLTDASLRKMFKAAATYDDDFDIDKSVWKSLEVERNGGKPICLKA